MYKNVLFPILKALSTGDAEQAHTLAIRAIQVLQRTPLVLKLVAFLCEANENPHPVEVFGIKFPNRIGLAAGLDKQAEMLLFLQALGFGFVEVGTVTPNPQVGNPRPRIARIPEYNALWNWLGFNSDGAQVVAERLKNIRSRIHIPIGGSLGKQKETSLDNAVRDYKRVLLDMSYSVDYYTANTSSPNTKGLRRLQGREYLEALIDDVVKTERASAHFRKEKPKPVIAKFAPDLDEKEMSVSTEAAERGGASGIIVGNTTTKPPEGFTPRGIFLDENRIPKGGYSGPWTFGRTLEMVRFVNKHTNLPIIACGGITNSTDACMLYDAGASLLQVLTGFIYQGPMLIRQLRSAG